MIEEIIIALSGSACWFDSFNQINSSKDLAACLELQSGESEVLSRLLQLKNYTRKIKFFVESHNRLCFVSQEIGLKPKSFGSDKHFGFYHTALAKGLDNVLQDYNRRLCLLEHEIKTDITKRNLIFMLSELHNYFTVFPILIDIIDRLQNDNMKGCQLFAVLCDQNHASIPMVEKEIAKLRQCCLHVFANQLIDWLNFGFIKDKYDEFFLIVNRDKNEAVMRSNYKPDFISDFDCRKIVFIGEKMRLIRLNKDLSSKSNFDVQVADQCTRIRNILIADTFDAHMLSEPVEILRKILVETLWHTVACNKDDDAVDVHENDKLFSCLECLRDFYFLGKGELFLVLIDALHERGMSTSATATAGAGIGYDRSITITSTRMTRDEELGKILDQSFLKLRETFLSDSSASSFGLDMINFKLTPLSSSSDQVADFCNRIEPVLKPGQRVKPLFEQRLLDTCAKIFKFLFKIRRLHVDLLRCWSTIIKGRQKNAINHGIDFVESPVLTAKIWRLTHLMLFFVRNLEFYLHTDVLESAYKTLTCQLRDKNFFDYQRAKELIEDFVNTIWLSCFSECKEISKLLDGLLESCRDFSVLILKQDTLMSGDDVPETVQNIYVAFERRSSLLFKILTNPKMPMIHPQLTQLLQHLDMNSYFSSTNLF